MGLMYEVPSYGRAYFEGELSEKPVVVGIGAAGVQLLDASDGDRPVMAEHAFDNIGSFVCSDEVRMTTRLLACLTRNSPRFDRDREYRQFYTDKFHVPRFFQQLYLIPPDVGDERTKKLFCPICYQPSHSHLECLTSKA